MRLTTLTLPIFSVSFLPISLRVYYACYRSSVIILYTFYPSCPLSGKSKLFATGTHLISETWMLLLLAELTLISVYLLYLFFLLVFMLFSCDNQALFWYVLPMCSIEFDRDHELFATAGVSKRIKIFELSSVRNIMLKIGIYTSSITFQQFRFVVSLNLCGHPHLPNSKRG